METNESSPKNLPDDIQRTLQKHGAVLRLSYFEIISGIKRLLSQGIPKEVITQVVAQTVEAVSKDFNPLTYQDFYSRIETQPDAFATDDASLREPPGTTRPPALAAFAVEEPALAENSAAKTVPECGELSAPRQNLNLSPSLHHLIRALPGLEAKQDERELCLGSIACPSDSAAQLLAEMKRNLAMISPIPSFHLMPPRGGNGPSPASKGTQMSASDKRSLTLDTVNQLPRHPQWSPAHFSALRRIRPSIILVQVLLRAWVIDFTRRWIAMINASELPEMKKSFLRWLRRPIHSNLWRPAKASRFEAPPQYKI